MRSRVAPDSASGQFDLARLSVPDTARIRAHFTLCALETGLAGWAYRTRTGESGRGPPDWICGTIRPAVGAQSGWRRPFACQLHDAHLQLGQDFGDDL